MAETRDLDDIKNDIRDRVGHRVPFLHAETHEVESALAKLDSVEPEPWASAWSVIGARWEKKAREEEARGNAGPAKEAYLKAYGYYGIGRHPFPNSPGKRSAYAKTREMYLAASRYFEIP